MRRGAFPAPTWGIIADDLTGATDAAAAFAQHGFRAVVVFKRRGRTDATADVVVLTSESRHDPPTAARRKVLQAHRWLRERRIPLLFKKLDSTWKGNIAAETIALRTAGNFESVLVCPANPAQGRIVRGGTLTAYRRVLVHLPEYWREQGQNDFVRAQSPIRRAQLQTIIHLRRSLIVADAASERDLTGLARAALHAPRRLLLVGSAALAGALAKALASSQARRRRFLPRDLQRPSTALILTGSKNPITQRQIEFLVQKSKSRVLDLHPLNFGQLQTCLSKRRVAVVRIPIHAQPERVLLRKLAALNPLFDEGLPRGLLVTGGDTASLVGRWLGVRSVTIHGEIVPGLAWGIIGGGRADGSLVCTKPGGFGSERAMVCAIEFLAGAPIVPRQR